MYPNQRILVIGVLCVFGGSLVKAENDIEWDNNIDWTLPDANHNKGHDTIDIDDKPMGSVYYGSGDSWNQQYDDTEVEDWSGDDNEGSGYMPEDSCLSLRSQMENKKVTGLYVPRCTPDGHFEKMQCHDSRGQCWCVDTGGREIPGTRRTRPQMPNCENEILAPKRRPGVQTRPEEQPDDIINLPNNNGNDQDEMDKKNDDLPNAINNMGGDPDVDIQTLAPDSNRVEGMLQSKGDLPNAVIQQPGILAGIVGGAVIGLLCAVLLVMFIVYRMRKKDEGSYALDEKRSPSHHTYQRANTREFYA